jgi:signal peptidase II
VTGLGVLVADQVTKSWAVSALDDGRIIDLIGSLRFRLVHNTGAAFSQGEGLGPVFAVLVVAVIVVLIRFGARLPDPSARVAVGAVIGGAVGNLADRLVRSGDGVFGGAVVDFVDLQWWPVFNVADMAVVVGGAAIVWISRHDPGSAATS